MCVNRFNFPRLDCRLMFAIFLLNVFASSFLGRISLFDRQYNENINLMKIQILFLHNYSQHINYILYTRYLYNTSQWDVIPCSAKD